MDVSTSTPAAAVSPLRQRMLEDMRMRQFAEHTQDGYIRAVRKLATFLGRSPHTASAEDLRRFQLHLVDTGTGPVTINATLTGLKFFFDITLGRPELMLKMTHVAVPRKLPVILSPEEVPGLMAPALSKGLAPQRIHVYSILKCKHPRTQECYCAVPFHRSLPPR